MNVLSAYDARAGCKDAEREAMARWRIEYPSAKITVKDETVWLGREESMPATLTRLDYYCLPDTVDPRGPKGK